MKNPRPDIEHWWAVEAMVASYNHVYRVTHKTKYKVHGPIGISIYDGAPIASFQYEFLALSADAQSVMDAVLTYPIPDDKQYILDVFHPAPSDPALKEQYTKFAHEFVRTGPILGYELPDRVGAVPANVFEAATIQQAETANHTLTAEGERIYVQTLRDKHIHSFYAEREGEAVGWIQLVSVYDKVGYINQLYVLKNYRKRKYGTALVQRAHARAIELGLKRMVAIPSDQAMRLYRRLGYRPLLYFSVFRPNGGYRE
ncbi:MAG: GNAT family N-acetyltransferase [Anaerolineales bacterium]|nr:GNAT family N-acetyltransferase [Anaerolineales bacterium]NUQ85924.1 GNAT family N-acetyltransferase [Anaerolineales bacterium]